MTMTPSLDVHVDRDERAAFGADVRAGLGAQPKWLPPKWLYDREGCALFARITDVAEYYPTRRERSTLAAHAADIARHSGADTLVELGSSDCDKTRLLLDALAGTGRLRRFVPLEINLATLTTGVVRMADAYPGVEVHAVAGDFERHLGELPTGGRRLVAFLGGTIGNLLPAPRAAFLATLASGLIPGDTLLLGTDLVKEPDRLLAAYDDAARRDCGVQPEHPAPDEPRARRRLRPRPLRARGRVERRRGVGRERLRACGQQSVHIAALDVTVEFADGEDLRTEVSAKSRHHGWSMSWPPPVWRPSGGGTMTTATMPCLCRCGREARYCDWRILMRTGDLAGAVGRGLVAGVAGTALMTVASTIEMKVQGREASTAPADAAAKVLGVEPTGDAEQTRFSNVVHWAYGTSWGALRGVLGAVGLTGPAAAGAHFATVWGSGLVMLPALGVAPPLKEWGAKALATDAFHHLVYAAATSVAFAALDRSSTS